MKRRMTTILRIAAAALLGAAVLGAAVWMMQYGQDGTAAMLLSRLPRSGWAAALCLWCLYALKSVVMVFPVTLLFAVGGMVFPLPRALWVNGVGLCIAVTLPYRLYIYIGALYNTAMMWLQGGRKESVEEIAGLFWRMCAAKE